MAVDVGQRESLDHSVELLPAALLVKQKLKFFNVWMSVFLQELGSIS